MPTPLAYVTPDVLRWARESMGISRREAADELGLHAYQIELAEQGDDLLTLRQAEELARFYDRSLATLFRPEPPHEETPEAQFRRLPGAPELPWPSKMHRLSRRVRGRQEAAAEIYDALEETPPWLTASRSFAGVAPFMLASVARNLLGVTLEEQYAWSDLYAPLRGWVDAVEALGILVMQDGSMEVETLRGFASLHDSVPAIVTNTKDDPRARAFTVIHELGHLVAGANRHVPEHATEAWCNGFAGEVLMPLDALQEKFAATEGSIEDRAAAVALAFSVTPLAAATRLLLSGLVSRDAGGQLIAAIRSREPRPRKPGGNYYRNKITWLGPAFTRLVLEAVDDQALTASSAAGLLEAKVNQFDRLRQTLEARSEFG